jgi:hypothetical protein
VVEEGTREGDVAGSNPTSREACEKCHDLRLRRSGWVANPWASLNLKQFFADFFDSVS